MEVRYLSLGLLVAHVGTPPCIVRRVWQVDASTNVIRSLKIKDGDVCSALQAIWLQNARHDEAGVHKSFAFARFVNA